MASAGFRVAQEALFGGGSKRKCVDDVAEEFSQFSLCSPARKMRRLDAIVPPIIDEGFESGIDSSLAQQPIELETSVEMSNSYIPPNEERALVLYKPVNASPMGCGIPPCISFQVDKNLIAELKEKTTGRLREEAAAAGSNNIMEADNRLAVVPWIPLRFPDGSGANASVLQDQKFLPVEAEAKIDDEAMSMDVEEESVHGDQVMNLVAPGASLQQWQQQHCMNMPSVVNTTTPVMWSW